MSDQFPIAPQHRDKLLVGGEEPQPGSHLISPRRGYTHHGIYVGDGKVVHYAGLQELARRDPGGAEALRQLDDLKRG